MSNAGEHLIRYRVENGLSQSQLALKLGISQAHISRIEKGTSNIPASLAEKIQTLIKRPVQTHEFKLDYTEEGRWRIASFKYPQKVSGDKIYINTKSAADKLWLLHCDAVGSSLASNKDGELLISSFETVINSNPGFGVSAESVYVSMNRTIKNTKNMWKGEPSANIISLSRDSNRMDVICGGMPNPIFFENKATAGQRVSMPKDAALLGSMSVKDYPVAHVKFLKKDDFMFFASDGFEDFYKQISRLPLIELFISLGRVHKGDVEGMGEKFLRVISEFAGLQKSNDDMSFLLISVR